MQDQGSVNLFLGDTRENAQGINIRFHEFDNTACFYIMEDGLYDTGTAQVTNVVLKTMRRDGKKRSVPVNEISALSDPQIDRLLFNTVDNEGWQWVVYKDVEGVNIHQAAAFRQKYPQGYNTSQDPKDEEDCVSFMDRIYFTAANALSRNDQWDPRNIGWENLRFSDDLKTATVVDWGKASLIKSDPAKYWGKRRPEYLSSLMKDSELALRDSANHKGICASEKRKAEIAAAGNTI
ncbi:hypothetical protein FRB99_005586 [Tulasnella sp. 403]|nr:hypothetical protein FRB99_005586 [Tulasnella sp. 403]